MPGSAGEWRRSEDFAGQRQESANEGDARVDEIRYLRREKRDNERGRREAAAG